MEFTKIMFYINLLGQIQTYRLAREILKQSYENVGMFDYYKLIDNNGRKIENPVITNNNIKLMLPIPDDIRDEKTIDIYINDQKQIIDVLIYEAGVGSMFYITFDNMFTEDDEKLVVVINYKLEMKNLLISTLLWIFILLSFLAESMLYFK